MDAPKVFHVHIHLREPEAKLLIECKESPRDVGDAADRTFSRIPGQSHFITSDSQSCSTTIAELSPGVIEGITKRLPSAETSNETTE